MKRWLAFIELLQTSGLSIVSEPKKHSQTKWADATMNNTIMQRSNVLDTPEQNSAWKNLTDINDQQLFCKQKLPMATNVGSPYLETHMYIYIYIYVYHVGKILKQGGTKT